MSLKNTIIGIFIIFILALLLSDGEPKKYAKWSYDDEDIGPKYWHELDERYMICKEGKNQSPINITNSLDVDLLPLKLQGDSKANKFINNGNTLEVSLNNGNYLDLNDRKYALKNINFHIPSEHKIDGKQYDMEAQLMHKDAYGNIAIISVLIEESNEDNITLNKLLRNLPEETEDELDIKSQITGYEILPENKDYYTYNGSLTTPPCSEGVRWIIIKTPLKASKSQLNDFKEVMPTNNRIIQNINARFILN